MLSKAELKFLLEGKTTDPGYDAVIRHRIRRKLLKFQRDALPALKQGDWTARWLRGLVEITENCNGIMEFRNLGENENSHNKTLFKNRWWARRDSNSGTSPCQGDVC